ncbi:unnamed protein product [Mytilus coruscus]|uniref:B box-type domain-containing protein n=1 Tax=Mytilus coruscus TaxID=42192 RepID=A0A6J8E9C3_MYTCO|nr:unnamed protein product [Mytilus coruscus]
MKCIFCGSVGKYEQCEKCLFKGCQKCIVSHKDSCILLMKDKFHFCEDHNKHVDKYCFDCFHLTCEKCVVGNHLNHNILPICEAVHNIRGDMQSSIEELELKIDQEQNAIDNGPKKQTEYKLLVKRIDVEERNIQECVTKTKATLLRNMEKLQKTEDDKCTASKDILPSMKQARTNLQSVKDEKNAILFLSRWSNPRSIIEKQGLLQKEREADGKASVIGSDISRQLLDPFIRYNSNNNQDSKIKTDQDLKHKIESVVKWTTQETQEREKERKDHVKALKDKDKIIQRYEVLTKAKDDDKGALESGPSGSKTSKLQQHIFDLQKIMAQNNEQYKKVCMERDDLRNRLSSIAGDKLTKGNPSITDLGDPNRPMKISEKYGELYDNEWTDCMEFTDVIKPHFGTLEHSELEEIIIHHLYRLLLCCYKECRMTSKNQIRTIRKTIAENLFLNTESEKDIVNVPGCKEVLSFRKQNGEEFSQQLISKQKLCGNVMKDWDYCNKSDILMQHLVKTAFFDKCVHLCWFMAIQEPKMFLDQKLLPGDKFDKNEYKEFVKSGDKVGYIVWPALFLHENGPLLYKGVVQAYI